MIGEDGMTIDDGNILIQYGNAKDFNAMLSDPAAS